MSNAVQLRRHAYTNITMQQALGMVVVLGLVAGLLPFLVNWVLAARMDAALPLARAARSSAQLSERFPAFFMGLSGVNPMAVSDFYLTAAGLDQPFPGWLAGGLSALGVWLNWPLRWLTAWIVYGALVMVIDKAFGATMTLQRFYAATGYAAVPLLLTGLAPIPCLGGLAVLVGIIWSVVVYVRANQDIAEISLLQSAGAVFLPAALLSLLVSMALGASLLSLFFSMT